MSKLISSPQNKTIKHLLQLQEKSRNRRHYKHFVIEGLREITLAVQAGYDIDTIYFCKDYINPKGIERLKLKTDHLIEITAPVYKKIAYRRSTEGIIALTHQKEHDLASLSLPKPNNPLLLVAEAPEKPGNIGALLRTADAANVDAMLIANPRTDLYNPNIIRSSVGCVFTNKIATGSSAEIIAFLQKHHINIYAATLQSSALYTSPDYQKPTAIVVGTEAHGLSQEWRKHATQNIIIPMQGSIDSMNVSVSAGVLIFEAKRQRGF